MVCRCRYLREEATKLLWIRPTYLNAININKTYIQCIVYLYSRERESVYKKELLRYSGRKSQLILMLRSKCTVGKQLKFFLSCMKHASNVSIGVVILLYQYIQMMYSEIVIEKVRDPFLFELVPLSIFS